MATMQWEVQSFVSKFTQLAHAGFNSSLNFNHFQGRMFVNFSSDLGEIQTPARPSKHVKPSQFRRRKRRREAREADKNANLFNEDVMSTTMTEQVTEGMTMVQDVSNTFEEETFLESSSTLLEENECVLSSSPPDDFIHDGMLTPEVMYETRSPQAQDNPNMLAQNSYQAPDQRPVNQDNFGDMRYWEEMAMMLRYLTASSNQR